MTRGSSRRALLARLALGACVLGSASAGAAPSSDATLAIVAPPLPAQTTRGTLRLVARVASDTPPSLEVNRVNAGECALVPGMLGFAHCTVPLMPGENTVTITSGGQQARGTVYRYVTTGPLIPGVELSGFGAGRVHTTAVEAVCQGCHQMNEGARASFAGSTCTSCHREVVERTRRHGPVANQACTECHSPETSKGATRHDVVFPIRETCFRCHEDMRATMAAAPYRHGPAAQGRCTTCHDPHGSEQPFWLKKPPFDLCTSCHTEKATGRHVITGFVYGDSHPVRDRKHPRKPDTDFACPSCHNPHAAAAPFLWQFGVTVREQLCQTCHQK